MIKAGIGMYGPYVLHEKTYKSLGKEDDILTIGLDRAVELLSQARVKVEAVPLKDLGKHPDDEAPVAVFEGRYGAYVKHKKTNATIPKDRDPTSVTLEEALGWLAERAAKGTKKKGGGATKKVAKKTKKKGTKKKKPE